MWGENDWTINATVSFVIVVGEKMTELLMQQLALSLLWGEKKSGLYRAYNGIFWHMIYFIVATSWITRSGLQLRGWTKTKTISNYGASNKYDGYPLPNFAIKNHSEELKAVEEDTYFYLQTQVIVWWHQYTCHYFHIRQGFDKIRLHFNYAGILCDVCISFVLVGLT